MVVPEAQVPTKSFESPLHIAVEVLRAVGAVGAGDTLIVMFLEALRQVPFWQAA